MKLVIASDIHGAAKRCEQLVAAIERERPDRVVLLGDLLYHGPRNDLPPDYAPRCVIELLSELNPEPIAVRGNCDAEVDQMVLPFPIMADFATLADEETGRTLFFTHGHIFGPGLHNSVDRLPDLAPDDALVYGHTHIKVLEMQPLPGEGSFVAFNPGSVGIPKDGSYSYGVYEDGRFEHRLLGPLG